MAHEKVYGICENKCREEVYPKSELDPILKNGLMVCAIQNVTIKYSVGKGRNIIVGKSTQTIPTGTTNLFFIPEDIGLYDSSLITPGTVEPFIITGCKAEPNADGGADITINSYKYSSSSGAPTPIDANITGKLYCLKPIVS